MDSDAKRRQDILDSSITVRDVLMTPMAYPPFEMSWAAYLSHPRGLHHCRAVGDGKAHTFVGESHCTPYAVACFAELVSTTITDEGGREHWKHYKLTINGVPVILRQVGIYHYVRADTGEDIKYEI